YDDYWRARAVHEQIKKTSVPNLNVAGWWDQEDFYGPIKIYKTLEASDSDRLNYLVVGPWNHGGSAGKNGRTLGKFNFDSDTAIEFRSKMEAPWFAYWLKDKGQRDFPEARTFETGSNRWRNFAEWPPRDNAPKKLYLRSAGRL